MGIRYIQPQAPVEIDWSNPFGARIEYYFTPDFQGGRSRSSPSTPSGGVTRVSGKYGIGLKGNGSSGYVAGPPNISIAGAGALTRFAVLRVGSGGSTRAILSSGGSGGAMWRVANNTDLVWVKTNLNVEFTQAGILSAGEYCILISVNNPAASAFYTYKNGVLVATTAAISTSAGGVASVGQSGTGSSFGDHELYLVGSLTGALSASEVAALSANPWQIFKSQSRRIFVASAGGVTLSPSLYVDPDTFYSPTVSPGAVTLSPSLFTESDTFYAATITPGAITLSPALVVDADTFYSATVTPGGVNLAPALLSSTNTFYSPTVSTGSVNISPSLFVDADTFYSPAVSLDGSPQTLTPGLFVDSDTFYSATVAAGGVTLNPSLFVDADTFYIPTVSLDGAPQNLTPSLYVDSDTFYSPVVSSSGSQNLSPSLFVDADIFYSFSMVNGGFAKRGEYDNSQSTQRSNIQTSRRR